MDARYSKNVDNVLTESIQNDLLTKRIAVIGCGGQGGYILEYLVRLGVKSIIYWDGDRYDVSNLNRQIGCTEKTLGIKKVDALTSRLQEVNSTIELFPRDWFFGDKSTDLEELLETDFVFMAADCYYNIVVLRPLIRKAIISGIPVVDCPIIGKGGYVRIETNNDLSHYDIISERLQWQAASPEEIAVSQTAYKCALLAAEAVNQMVLYFSRIRSACVDTRLDIDLYHHKRTLSDRFGIL